MRTTLAALISPLPLPSLPGRDRRGLGRALALALATAASIGLASAAHAGDNGAFDVSCQGGPGMTAQQAGSGTRWEIGFMIGEGEQPNPGECTFDTGGLPQGGRPVLVLPATAPNTNLVIQATKGGTFNLKAMPRSDGTFQVTAIMQVNVVDSTPLSPGPQGGGEAGEPAQGGEGGGMAEGGEEGGGMAVPSAGCPAGSAMVQTPEGLDFLNVREGPSTSAKVVAQVPNQSEVSVTGACLRPAAGLTKQKVPIAATDWCRIEAPEQGCVKAEFLVFGEQVDPAKGAGFAATKKKH